MKLSVRDLSFSYMNEPVLENVSFTADDGERVAILGTNGAGKSTLLKCVDGILRAKKGEILIDGINIRAIKRSELAKKLGYVPQTAMFSDMTVFDAVLVGRKPYIRWEATKKDMEIVDELLAKLHMSDIAMRNVLELSGGEQQKVAIARALAQKPDILLFDEPTSNLDIKNQMEVVSFIKQIAQDNKLTVLVTMHDINLAMRLADKFALMKNNTVSVCGGHEVITPENIRDIYGLNVFVDEVRGQRVLIPA